MKTKALYPRSYLPFFRIALPIPIFLLPIELKTKHKKGNFLEKVTVSFASGSNGNGAAGDLHLMKIKR